MSDADRIGELRERWLDAADDDLRTAVVLLATPDYGIYRIPCFLAQQAAEKMLKGVLTHLQIDFPPTHDLERASGTPPGRLESGPGLHGPGHPHAVRGQGSLPR